MSRVSMVWLIYGLVVVNLYVLAVVLAALL